MYRDVLRRLLVEAAEAEPALAVVERGEPLPRPLLDGLRGDLRRSRAGGAEQRLAHAVQAGVGVVDVRLLRGEIGVGHAGPSYAEGFQPTKIAHPR